MTETANFLGIEGFSKGAAGIWILVVLALGGVIKSWISGLADRKRAETEGLTAAEKAELDARSALFVQMQQQMATMQATIDILQQRVAMLEDERLVDKIHIAALESQIAKGK
jgi:uncharacterized protein HemX